MRYTPIGEHKNERIIHAKSPLKQNFCFTNFEMHDVLWFPRSQEVKRQCKVSAKTKTRFVISPNPIESRNPTIRVSGNRARILSLQACQCRKRDDQHVKFKLSYTSNQLQFHVTCSAKTVRLISNLLTFADIALKKIEINLLWNWQITTFDIKNRTVTSYQKKLN